jgi:hypothetical protein
MTGQPIAADTFGSSVGVIGVRPWVTTGFANCVVHVFGMADVLIQTPSCPDCRTSTRYIRADIRVGPSLLSSSSGALSAGPLSSSRLISTVKKQSHIGREGCDDVA